MHWKTNMKLAWPLCLTFPRKPDFIIGSVGDTYVERWWVIPRNRLFNIYLHHFIRSDDDRAFHDHPWVNCSVLLRGSYVEVTPPDPATRAPGDLIPDRAIRRPFRPVLRGARAAHRVELIDGRPVWTLFLTGPTRRSWGFLCPNGWRHWQEFITVRDGGNSLGKGCE
jgi:hypothetical protein